MTEARDPFAAPRVAVSESEVDPRGQLLDKRPAAVNIALFLIGIGILNSILAVLRAPWPVTGPEQYIALGFGVLAVLVDCVLFNFVARGHNWARIVLLVITIFELAELSLLFYAWYFTGWSETLSNRVAVRPPMSDFAWLFLPRMLSLASVILLFGPGRAWFRKRGVG